MPSANNQTEGVAMRLLLCVLAAFFLCSHAIKRDLLHSLDGGRSFEVAGTIESNKLRVQLHRERSQRWDQELKNLVAMDGFYILRIASGRSDLYVTAAVRAACLAAGHVHETLNLHMDAEGRVMSLAYTLDGLEAHPCKASGKASLPETSTVQILKPVEGPMVISAAAPQADEVLSSAFTGDSMQAGSSGFSGGPTSRPRGQVPNQQQAGKPQQPAGSGEGETVALPPEEKSWWQKNWMLLLGGGLAVVNIFGNLAKQTQQPQQAAAGAGRAAAATR